MSDDPKQPSRGADPELVKKYLREVEELRQRSKGMSLDDFLDELEQKRQADEG